MFYKQHAMLVFMLALVAAYSIVSGCNVARPWWDTEVDPVHQSVAIELTNVVRHNSDAHRCTPIECSM